MKVLIILLMFVMSLYSAGIIADNEKRVEAGYATVETQLSIAGCLALMVITVAFDAACLYMLVKVV
jgi:predicted Co/Zn/Cd cation transporter (cation efflux family)